MESYAPKEATEAFLVSLGFTRYEDTVTNLVYFDSPGEDVFGAVVQVYIYQCNNGYYCVDVDGGYREPAVWNGPKAEWDEEDPGEKFETYLDHNFPEWR